MESEFLSLACPEEGEQFSAFNDYVKRKEQADARGQGIHTGNGEELQGWKPCVTGRELIWESFPCP